MLPESPVHEPRVYHLPNGEITDETTWKQVTLTKIGQHVGATGQETSYLCRHVTHIAPSDVDEFVALAEAGHKDTLREHLKGLSTHLFNYVGCENPEFAAAPDHALSSRTAPDQAPSSNLDNALADMQSNVKEGEEVLDSVSGTKRRNPNTGEMEEN